MKKKVKACKAKHDLMETGQCQGCSGHKGHHWFYAPDGSLTQWRNDSDPKSKKMDDMFMKRYGGFGCSYTPPDHASYTHPKGKMKMTYRWLKYKHLKPKK